MKSSTKMIMWPVTANDKEKHPTFKEGKFTVRNIDLQNFEESTTCANNTAF